MQSYKLAGWPAQLTVSAFNQLGQFAGHRADCYAELAVFFQASSSCNHR